MKKSLPIQQSVSNFFQDPCPVLSDNNVHLITDEITRGYNWIVEYGMGASTLYFLKEAQKKNSRMISIENNFDWFQICIQQILNQTDLKQTDYSQTPWSVSKIYKFARGNEDISLPPKMRRLPRWKESLTTGPFFRFSPESKSRLSGKLGILWPVAKPAFAALMKFIYLTSPFSRPIDGEWRGEKNDFQLILRNIGPTIKDQYGEAPNMGDYIDAGLKDIRQELEEGKTVSALFIIDGGPRHKIVEAILDLEERYTAFLPTIVLCDAARKFYHPVLSQRQEGRFIAGSNKTLKGESVSTDIADDGDMAEFWVGENKTGEAQSRQEVWFYTRSAQTIKESALSQ